MGEYRLSKAQVDGLWTLWATKGKRGYEEKGR